MIIAFQVVLLFVIVMSFLGVLVEKNNAEQEIMLVTFLSSLVAFIVSVLWL